MNPYLQLGTRNSEYRRDLPVSFSVADRRRHMAVIGRTGVGKSTLLANLFAQDANDGRGVALIDPHGDLAHLALDLIPPRRIRKTVYFNPADMAHPIGFNPLENVPPDQRAARAADIVAAFRAIWGASWGPRLEYILYETIAALLEMPSATLLGVPRMLVNERYRERVVARISDVMVRAYWEEEHASYTKSFAGEAISPILNKIGQVLAAPAVRNILGQPNSTIHPRHLMDRNYIVVANLAKGLLGAQHANLLGALFIASFGSAAMSRADLPEHDRKDFSLIVDEFHNYTTDALPSLLSEARKYRLSFVLANQYLSQLTDSIRSGLLGTVGSLIAFRVGAEDASVIARELSPIREDALTDTPNFEAWARLLSGGAPSERFLLATYDAPAPHGRRDVVIAQSRRSFSRERAQVEARIARFMRNL